MAPHSSTLAWRIPWMEESVPGPLAGGGSTTARGKLRLCPASACLVTLGDAGGVCIGFTGERGLSSPARGQGSPGECLEMPGDFFVCQDHRQTYKHLVAGGQGCCCVPIPRTWAITPPSQYMGPRSCLPLHSPVRAPRVLHNPVGYPFLFSVPNSQHCVVYFIWSLMTGSTGKGK